MIWFLRPGQQVLPSRELIDEENLVGSAVAAQKSYCSVVGFPYRGPDKSSICTMEQALRKKGMSKEDKSMKTAPRRRLRQ